MRALLVLTASVASAWAQMAGGSRLLTYDEAYSGIGRLRASLSCTAFFVRTADSGPAYAVAAGHCFDLAPNRVWIGLERQSTVAFRYFVDSQDRQLVVRSTRVVYSTMKGHDVSIILNPAVGGVQEGLGLDRIEMETGKILKDPA